MKTHNKNMNTELLKPESTTYMPITTNHSVAGYSIFDEKISKLQRISIIENAVKLRIRSNFIEISQC